ncbi:MAG: cryptochrome/photolyase family protein [Phenylobacterium sp.]|uniref:cryptochrome/photolyase family protein n=1 Tax=Phenylobacterium sp. TaxID=1871053 RepID=UPI001B5B4B33|nr:cryptochrome/photolyase family protein [Phenylobacterium sp.]MBP7650083.1 cryptochrome/photolyase family protein [Phenylobacterium sp.]MBP7814643.1 cryptochrome/photolyase family protein [Phenylobacterium sp.]
MPTLRLILADQLSTRLAVVAEADKSADIFLMAEVMAEASYVNHHVKKIAFLFSAMRHYAAALRAAGYRVRYVALEDAGNSQSLEGEILRAVGELAPSRVVVTEPGEWRLRDGFEALRLALPVDLEILPDTRFLCSHDEFAAWAGDRRELRMEYFYRDMRRRHDVLMEPGGKPAGGRWNYDADNRKPPKAGLKSPPRLSFKKDEITREVLDLVRRRFPEGYGRLEPFHFAVTRRQALAELDHFIAHILPGFGDYQDAMVKGEPWLRHSLLAAYINAGLLYPLEVCRKAEAAFRAGRAPLNAAEGFIRQILGWREYVRGVYWRFMPGYLEQNALAAHEPLPWFYWTGETQMACVREALAHTYDHAYSHHIQRLMITGNFALLAGLAPKAVHEWYLAVYADAYEWVEAPNTLGMALHADGGLLASKPYAASGAYIRKMSNFCQGCAYDPTVAVGDRACPFNALYWDFMARHRERFSRNARMPYVYATWDRMGPERQTALRGQAQKHLTAMREGTL